MKFQEYHGSNGHPFKQNYAAAVVGGNEVINPFMVTRGVCAARRQLRLGSLSLHSRLDYTKRHPLTTANKRGNDTNQ